MSEYAWLRGAALLALCIILAGSSATASGIQSMGWKGEDLVIRFSDSVGYRIDLAESDTAQVVVRFKGAELPPEAVASGLEAIGPAGRRATLIQASPGELRLTVTSTDRMGYGTLWRPYSNSLVLHTFRWRQLEYAEEQYFKGLLAWEQNLEGQGLELMRLAYANGNRRAASALGVYYARHGDYALAVQYLREPSNADDFAALAAIVTAAGDTAGAARYRQSFERLVSETPRSVATSAGPTPEPQANIQTQRNNSSSFKDAIGGENWPWLVGSAVLLILLILLITRLGRRSSAVSPAEKELVAVSPEAEISAEHATQRTDTEPPQPEETPIPAAVVDETVAEETVAEETVAEETVAEETTIPVPVAATQAADLRQRIEAVRSGLQAPLHPATSTAEDGSILNEARRLHVSRDSVELRKRLEAQKLGGA